MDNMTKDEMLAAADSIIGTRSINDMPIDQIHRLITVAQFVTDLCLHEIEKLYCWFLGRHGTPSIELREPCPLQARSKFPCDRSRNHLEGCWGPRPAEDAGKLKVDEVVREQHAE